MRQAIPFRMWAICTCNKRCETQTQTFPVSSLTRTITHCTLTCMACSFVDNMNRESALVQSIYYGKISRETTERLMEKYGREGSFLLRDSETVPGAFCLCVRKTPFVLTYRLQHSSDGWTLQVTSGDRQPCFGMLARLIESYRGGIVSDVSIAPLTHPLDKTQLEVSRLEPGSVYMEM